MLLSIVVPIIGYLLYGQLIAPRLQDTSNSSSQLQTALQESQIRATARAEVWESVTSDAQNQQLSVEEQSFRATTELALRETIELETAATRSAELLQQSTIAAVETNAAVELLMLESTISVQIEGTAQAVAAAAAKNAQEGSGREKEEN